MADIRQEWTGGDPMPDGLDDVMDAPAKEPTEEPSPPSVPLNTQEQRTQHLSQVITAWHHDTVAVGFLHRGGRCGCHYLARVVLDSVAPVEPEAPEEEPEDQPEEAAEDGN